MMKLCKKVTVKTCCFLLIVIVADISKYFALNIGDFIFTGTPAGVGECVVGDVLVGLFGK